MTPADLSAILPLICVGAAAIAVMLMVAVHRSYVATFLLTLTGLAAAFATLPWMVRSAPHPLTPLLMLDGYAALYTGLLVLAAAGSVLLAFDYLQKYEGNREEFFILMLLATLGAVVLAAGNHFASFFLGIELLSISLYSLVAYPHKTDSHIEAGVKYLVLAAVSSSFILFGMALIYAGSGSMAIDRIGPALSAMPASGRRSMAACRVGNDGGRHRLQAGGSAFPPVDTGRLSGRPCAGNGLRCNRFQRWSARGPAAPFSSRRHSNR